MENRLKYHNKTSEIGGIRLALRLFPAVLLFLTAECSWAQETAVGPAKETPAVISAFKCQKQLSAAESEAQLQALEKSYGQFSALKANFLQTSFFMGLGETLNSRGEVRFRKPGMMDWDYQSPVRQRFVADGQTLWFYQPELNQVTLGTFASSFNSNFAVSFLLGVGQLRQTFRAESACTSSQGTVFSLKPLKADPNLEEFYLLVDPQRKLPIGAKIIDVGGNETAITFEDIALDVALDQKQFIFDLPRGVDIIDNREDIK